MAHCTAAYRRTLHRQTGHPNLLPRWTAIDETNAGTIDNPIPYNGNMALEAGKYYSEDDIVYYCNTGTGNPVYSPLKDLVGVFVEVANG